MNIPVKPLYDRIFFTFVEDLLSTNFMPKTKSGIFISDNFDYSEVKKPQWGKVQRCGDATSEDILSSTYILIEPGKWTTRINVDDLTFWQTEEKHVLAVSNDIEATVKY
jgi:co-chaperonin GroES (HSP10)